MPMHLTPLIRDAYAFDTFNPWCLCSWHL